MTGSFVVEVGVSLCWQISLIVLVTLGLQRWVGTAIGGCRLWTICFVSILALIAAALLLPHRRWFAFPDFVSHDALVFIATWQGSIVNGLLVVWAGGVLVKVLRRGLGCWQLLHFLDRHCAPLSRDEITRRWSPVEPTRAMLAHPATVPMDVCVLVSDQIQGPFCWQLHRPIVVLPKYLLEGEPASLRHVWLHEIEHLRTRHPMQHFLQGVCNAVFWFHPMVWIASNRAELTREFLCDEVAAVTEGKFGAYLRTLSTIAERCHRVSCTHVPGGTLAFGNRPSALLQRCDHLVRLATTTRTSPNNPLRTRLAAASLVIVTIAVSQFWLPTNAAASSRAAWSPWPTWTAAVLHSVDIQVRDFEPFDEHTPMHSTLPLD